MCICVGAGWEGPVTSFKVNFNFPKFQGVQHMLSGGGGGGGGGGIKLFSKGVESNCLLSDRSYDFVLDPCPRSRSAQLSRILIVYGDSLFSCLFSSFIMYPLRCMFYSNLKV